MTCQELQEWLPDYESGELPPARHEFVSLHLEQCPHCRQAVADLCLTRRQLESLRLERWQPDLTVRVGAGLARQRLATGAARWTLRLGAVAAVAFVLALLLQARSAPGPVSPPPVTVYLTAGDAVVALHTGTGASEPVGSPEGRLFLGVAPDGRTAWWLRDVEGLSFALDALDLESGEVRPDPAPKPGRAYGGALATDGRSVYVVASVQGVTYLKRVETATRTREEAWSLGDFPPEAAILPREDRVYLAAAGHLAAVTREGTVTVRTVRGLTPTATLERTGRLVAARAEGGLLLVDPASGRVMGRMTGPVYEALAAAPGGGYVYAAAGSILEIRAGQRLELVGSLPLPDRALGLIIR